jgi:hypothetical protein
MSSLTSTDTEDACPGNMSRSYGGRTNYQYTPAACIIRACTISSSAPTKSNGAINCFPRFLRSMNRRACLFSSRPYTTRRQGHYEQFQRTAITWIFHGELITPRTPSLGHVEIDFPRTATRFPLSLISRRSYPGKPLTPSLTRLHTPSYPSCAYLKRPPALPNHSSSTSARNP